MKKFGRINNDERKVDQGWCYVCYLFCEEYNFRRKELTRFGKYLALYRRFISFFPIQRKYIKDLEQKALKGYERKSRGRKRWTLGHNFTRKPGVNDVDKTGITNGSGAEPDIFQHLPRTSNYFSFQRQEARGRNRCDRSTVLSSEISSAASHRGDRRQSFDKKFHGRTICWAK